MVIALIQEKQNDLYRFKEEKQWFEREELYRLQRKMIDQNLDMLRQAAGQGADLALTSEAVNFPGQPCWSDIPAMEAVEETQDYLLKSCSQIARDGKMNLVTGMLRIKEDKRLYNSAVVFDWNGDFVFSYDKNFLVGNEKEYLTPGGGFPVWNSEFGKIGIGICWDLQFPETARAYENGIYAASAMAVPAWKPIEGKRSPSQIIAPDGRVLISGSREKAEVAAGEIRDIRECREMREMRIRDLRWRFPEGNC